MVQEKLCKLDTCLYCTVCKCMNISWYQYFTYKAIYYTYRMNYIILYYHNSKIEISLRLDLSLCNFYSILQIRHPFNTLR